MLNGIHPHRCDHLRVMVPLMCYVSARMVIGILGRRGSPGVDCGIPIRNLFADSSSDLVAFLLSAVAIAACTIVVAIRNVAYYFTFLNFCWVRS